MENKVISRAYVEKNYIHKDKLKEILTEYRKTSITDHLKIIEFWKKLEALLEVTKDEQIQKHKNNN